MPFVTRGGLTPKVRVYDRTGTAHVRSLKSRDPAEIAALTDFVRWLRRTRKWEAIDMIVARRLSIPDAYDAHEGGRLAEAVSRAEAGLRAELERAADVDLSPLVAEWNGRGRKATSAKYVAQVRRMIPEGQPFPRSGFTRRAVAEFLAGLDVDNPTRNRYRAALRQFARWLVGRDVLETNVVRDVDGYPENAPRMVWYERDVAKRIIARLPEPFRSLESMMIGTGMEWQAIERVRARDVNLVDRTILARGGKTKWRTRTVVVTEPWAWRIVAAHLKALAKASADPDAPIFPVREKEALAAHHAAVAAVQAPPSTLHDWRHSYAIWNLSAGVPPAYVRPQLGHAPNSTVLERVYAAWIPTPLQRAQAAKKATRKQTRRTPTQRLTATKRATTTRKRSK